MAAVGDMGSVRDENGELKSGKLHGRAFYESLGSPKFVLAPMVDQSEFVSGTLHLKWMRGLVSYLDFSAGINYLN